MNASSRSRIHLLEVLATLVAVAALAAALVGCSSPSASSGSTSNDSGAASQSAASEEQSTLTGLRLNIVAPEWNKETSTPMIAAIEPFVEGVTDSTPIYRSINANETVDLGLDAGLYRITFISGVNQDGSIYTFSEAKEYTAEAIDADTATIEVEGTLVSAASVTPEQMQHVIAATVVACNSEDMTDGTAVMEAAVKNAQNAPGVSVEAIDAAQADAANAITNGTGSDITLNTPPQNLS